MSIIPTWPITAAVLVAGIAMGAGIDRLAMNRKVSSLTEDVRKADKRYTDLDAEVREQARLREVQRGIDERKAREDEQRMAARISAAEQEKQHEIAAVRSSADALIDRLRRQAAAASKPATAGSLPQAVTPGSDAAGAIFLSRGGEWIVRLAERADQTRASLAACYRWADAVEGSNQQPTERAGDDE